MGTQNCGGRKKEEERREIPQISGHFEQLTAGKEKGAFNLQHGARKDGRYRHVRQKVSCIDYDLL